MELSAKYGVPEEKAALAALLHDAGKGMTREAMVRYVKVNKVPVPHWEDVIKHNPSLLHSFISAHIAKKRFGITDHDVLEAISLHTVGSGRMSILAKIIYVADATTFDRRYSGVAGIRRQSRRNLDKAFSMTLANKILHVVNNKKWLNPDAVEAWNSTI